MPFAQAEYACVERDVKEAEAATALFEKILKGQAPEIRSVDSLMAALPENVRRNFIPVTNSRSLQASNLPGGETRGYINKEGRRVEMKNGREVQVCPEARVLFFSNDGDVTCSFTTHPGVRGGENVECMIFDSKTSKITPWELSFPGDPQSNPAAAASANPPASHAEKNPSSCINCHGVNTNYRLDPYRFWGDTMPFSEDMLRKGSYETECYNQLLDRIEAGEPRLRHLKPLNTKAEIQAALERDGQYQVKATRAAVTFAGQQSPALNLSHSFLEKNGCRTAAELVERPDWNKIKYAALGGFLNCGNTADFLPPSAKDNADKFFADRNQGLKNGKFSEKALLNDTHKRQAELVNVKKARIAWQMSQYVGRAGAEKEMQEANEQRAPGSRGTGYGMTNFENYSTNTVKMAKLRYLLEPLGVDVAQWSMAADRTNYAHADFLFSLQVQKPFLEIMEKDLGLPIKERLEQIGVRDFATCQDHEVPRGQPANTCSFVMDSFAQDACPKLAQLSREALGEKPATVALEETDVCLDKEMLSTQAVGALEALGPDLTKKLGRDILEQRCAMCHQDGLMGAYQHPFHNPARLEDQLYSTRNDPMNLADQIWDRVNRPMASHGHMPFSGEMLSPEDRVVLKAYLDQSQQGKNTKPLPGPDPRNTSGGRAPGDNDNDDDDDGEDQN